MREYADKRRRSTPTGSPFGPHPYAERGGCIVYAKPDGTERVVCDFVARLTREMLHFPSNDLFFEIEGETQTGRTIRTEISAARYESPGALRGCLRAAVGADGVIYRGMAAHLPPALISLGNAARRPAGGGGGERR